MVTALRDITFETRHGEFLVIVGPSGCGKTTLLRIVAGLLDPTRGKVEKVCLPGETNENVRLVFQENSLFPWMTVLENAAFGLKMAGVARHEREERAHQLLARFGFNGFERAYPHQLSLGMKQRVAVIRGFLSNPSLLLMDEPFAAIDCQLRRRLHAELLDLWEQDRKGVIYVTHDVEEAILLSDRILVMSAHPGAIIADLQVPFPRPRSPQLAGDPEFAAEFTRINNQIWNLLGEGTIPIGEK